uniref:Uncharacterized protein n=1 Tax=Arundo donax TaxID=35708 RepID=A0A0A9C943_ARUDO
MLRSNKKDRLVSSLFACFSYVISDQCIGLLAYWTTGPQKNVKGSINDISKLLVKSVHRVTRMFVRAEKSNV